MNNKSNFLPKLKISIPDNDTEILLKKQSIYNELPKKNNINHSIFELLKYCNITKIVILTIVKIVINCNFNYC